MANGLYSGTSGLALGSGLYRDVSGLWGGASGLVSGFGGFTPASLFVSGEQGVWYDPSDFSSMFQDSAGTVPVTAVGQSVGRISDKSGRGNHATQANASQCPILQQDGSGLYYLLFDGTDDGMVTGNITPGTDKVQAFLGLRKLLDGVSGVLVELSAALTANSGTFQVLAPGVTSEYRFRSRGTVLAVPAISGSYPAPVTSVVTGIGEIATDTALLRVNGAQVASAAGDQGAGDYLTYPLYIGRRGGTANPFNGRLYSMIVRFGSNLDAATIQQTESWVNSKTGAY